MLGANASQPIELDARDERTGRVVRADEEQRPRAVSDARSTLATSIVHRSRYSRSYRVADHSVETRQVIEERIARTRHQHFVTGIGQQFEQQRIRVAGAGRQRDPIRGDGRAPPLVVARDGTTGVQQTERTRLVDQPPGIGERCEQIGRILEFRPRRIRLGQVDNRPPFRARLPYGMRQPIGTRSAGTRDENVTAS